MSSSPTETTDAKRAGVPDFDELRALRKERDALEGGAPAFAAAERAFSDAVEFTARAWMRGYVQSTATLIDRALNAAEGGHDERKRITMEAGANTIAHGRQLADVIDKLQEARALLQGDLADYAPSQ